MAIATFPSFAKILLSGFSQKRESALIRTEMDSGPPRQAKIKSRVMITRTATILLDNLNEFLDFEDWYALDCNEGANWFQFKDPLTKATITARFSEGGYTAVPMSGISGPWQITTKIEAWGQ